MGNRICIVVIVVIVMTYQSHETLIQFPRDTTSRVNQSTYFNCSTDLVAEEVFWYHGGHQVYAGRYAGIFDKYEGRVIIEINKATGACNLIIPSLQPADSGKYKCQENEGAGKEGSAQLIVLDNEPSCESNMNTEGVIGQNKCNMQPDKVKLSCSGSYHGTMHPRVEWKKVGDDKAIADGLSNATSYGSYNYTKSLELTGDLSLDNSSYICQITGTTSEPYQCTIDILKVLYSVGNVDAVHATRGESIDCVANNTFPCSYLWYYGNETVCPVSCDKHLKTHLPGEYQCKAKCTVRGTECSFDVMRVFVTEEPPTPQPETLDKGTFVAVVLISALVVGAVLILLLLLLFRRSKVMKKHLTEEIRLDLYEEKLIHFMLSDKYFRASVSTPAPHTALEPIFEENKNFLFKIEMEPSSGIKTINGLAILDDEIFVVSERCSNIDVYFYEDFSYSRQLTLKELIAAVDLVSCNRNKWLYVMDKKTTGKSKEILKVDITGDLIKRWSTGEDRGYLSVTKESNVVMTVQARNRIVEYSPDGQIIRKIKLSQSTGLLHLWHSVKVDDDCYVVSHGLHSDALHRVCIVDADGNVKRSFGREIGATVEQLNVPFYLAVGGDSVFVADSHNNRVLILNTKLEFQKEIGSMSHKFFGPRRIHLDEEKCLLVFATSAIEPTVETSEYCHILAFNLKPELKIA